MKQTMRRVATAFCLMWILCTLSAGCASIGNGPAAARPTTAQGSDARLRRAEIQKLVLNCEPAVFAGEQLPKPAFRDPLLAEHLLGKYALKTTYYDANYNVVARAASPGRYGALVEVTTAGGPAFKRYCTLFRQNKPIDWFDRRIPIAVAALPPELGIDPRVVREQQPGICEYFNRRLSDASEFSDTNAPGALAAVLFAGLYETHPGDAAVKRCDAFSRDRRWWTLLKKKTGDLVNEYYTILPAGYEQHRDKRWPVILFLHGGPVEDDVTPERLRKENPLARAAAGKDFPFIVVGAFAGTRQWWNVDALDLLLDEVIGKYRVDADRIYLTGLSMGGYATWDMAMAFPNRFAAIAPICGAGDETDVDRIRDLPAWIFHGGNDPLVPVERAHQMMTALHRAGGRARLTIYPDAGHDCWTRAYQSEELYAWLLQQKRGKPSQPRLKP